MARGKRASGSSSSKGSTASATVSAERVISASKGTTLPEVQAVRQLFTEAQRTVQCHQRCCDSLRRLLFKHEAAWVEYFTCVTRILVCGKRDAGVERLVLFIALVAASSAGAPGAGQGEDVLVRTVEFLLERSIAADKAVRFRCCQIVGAVWAEMRSEQERPMDLADRVVEVLLPRLRDKVAGVRVQAVDALGRLQLAPGYDEDEESGKDQVTEELIRVMASDSSGDVRQAALAVVIKTPDMLDQLVLRTQDVKESVRKAAFRTLGDHVNAKHLQTHQTVLLIQRGLSDSSPAVVDACRVMLCTRWLRDAGDDPVQLLALLDVVNHEELAEKVVKEIINLGLRADRERGDPSLGMDLSLKDAKALRQAAARQVDLVSIPGGGGGAVATPSAAQGGATAPGGENVSAGGGQNDGSAIKKKDGEKVLSPAEALFARVQAEVVKGDEEIPADEKETRLEAISPDTTSLCAQIERLSEALSVSIAEAEEGFPVYVEDEVFVLQQLLKLAAHADFSEEAGRRRLINLLQTQLMDANTHCDLVEVSMLALAAAHRSESDLVRLVAELVSDISDHLKPGETSILQGVAPLDADASFTSVLSGDRDEEARLVGINRRASLEQSVMSQRTNRTTIRAAIPKNFVRDRARIFEVAGAERDGDGNEGRPAKAGSGSDEGDDELFADALSHLASDTNNDNDDTGGGEGDIRSVAAGGGAVGRGGGGSVGGAPGGELDEGEEATWAVEKEEALMVNRMFRILDMLSALLTRTKQTLAKDPTLAGFGDVIMESFEWYKATRDEAVRVELRELTVQCLGKYSLLGEMAAVSQRPCLLKIAECEEEHSIVRLWAMQALSDLSLAYGGVIVGSSGDLMSLYTNVLKERREVHGYEKMFYRKMVAVAAEAAARLLYFKLAQDPEVLARLFVLYFEKGSVADPSAAATMAALYAESGHGHGQEGQGEGEAGVAEEEGSAKDVGSPVRLCQILGVYFMSIPFGGPKVRNMVLASVRHVLSVLREIAIRNAALQEKAKEQDENEASAQSSSSGRQTIDAPVQDTIKFVLDLLMRQGTAAAAATAAAASTNVGTPAADEDTDKESVEGENINQSKEPATTTSDESSAGQDRGGGSSTMIEDFMAEDATGHVALCVADELFTCSGKSELAGTHVPCLAKLLASLPLPEDDQAAVKRLRLSVERLQAIGDGQFDGKVLRVIKKYAKTLLDADLTPNEGMGDGGDDDNGGNDSEKDSRGEVEGGEDREQEKESAPMKEQKSTRTTRRSSAPRVPPAPSARPTRQSKVAAKVRMSSSAEAEAAAAVADAVDTRSISSDSESDPDSDSGNGVGAAVGETEVEDSRGVVDAGDRGGHDEVSEEEGNDDSEDDSDSDAFSDNSTATVKTRSPVRSKRSKLVAAGRKAVVPLAEISNDPAHTSKSQLSQLRDMRP